MADYMLTYRLIVKEVAKKHGYHATFMPKPLFGENGSGMHTHMSLFTGRPNAVLRRRRPRGTSPTSARRFIAGQLRHAREISAVFAQWVNSYKRLVPGYEAPVYVAWSQRNRSALIRIPLYKPGLGAGDAGGDPLPRPRLQPVPDFRGAPARGPRGDRAGLRAADADGDEPLPPHAEQRARAGHRRAAGDARRGDRRARASRTSSARRSATTSSTTTSSSSGRSGTSTACSSPTGSWRSTWRSCRNLRRGVRWTSVSPLLLEAGD